MAMAIFHSCLTENSDGETFSDCSLRSAIAEVWRAGRLWEKEHTAATQALQEEKE